MTTKKKRKFVEPVTIKVYTCRGSREDTTMHPDVRTDRISNTFGSEDYTIPARLIHEKDYQALLKLARKGYGRRIGNSATESQPKWVPVKATQEL